MTRLNAVLLLAVMRVAERLPSAGTAGGSGPALSVQVAGAAGKRRYA